MKNKQAEIVKSLSVKELLYNVYLTQLIIIVIAFIIGFFLFDSWSEFFSLFQWSDWRILYIGIPIGLLIVLYDWIMMKYTPSHYHDDGGINQKLFSNLSVPMIFFIALFVSICEEILFRGVLQTHIGLVWTSIIFALVHYRYLFNWYLFVNVTALSFSIGILYEWTNNLWVVIATHFIIDFILGLIIRFMSKEETEDEFPQR